MGVPRQWFRSLLSGTTSGLDDGFTRVVREITEWCTRVRSGARGYGVAHEGMEWCTRGARVRVVHEYRVVHENEWCTRTSGARVGVVHKKRKTKEKQKKMFIQIKSIRYYNIYIYKLKLSINYSD